MYIYGVAMAKQTTTAGLKIDPIVTGEATSLFALASVCTGISLHWHQFAAGS